VPPGSRPADLGTLTVRDASRLGGGTPRHPPLNQRNRHCSDVRNPHQPPAGRSAPGTGDHAAVHRDLRRQRRPHAPQAGAGLVRAVPPAAPAERVRGAGLRQAPLERRGVPGKDGRGPGGRNRRPPQRLGAVRPGPLLRAGGPAAERPPGASGLAPGGDRPPAGHPRQPHLLPLGVSGVLRQWLPRPGGRRPAGGPRSQPGGDREALRPRLRQRSNAEHDRAGVRQGK
jgi:translation initiation factor IF-2